MEKKLRILVVEDDRPTLEMYSEVFRNKGVDVLEAKDGKEGLEKALSEIPDVIFTGIMMPQMTGFELMEELKKVKETADIPVVISSHLGKESDRRKSLELGAKDFIVRGFTPPNQVAERLKELFEEKGTYRISLDALGADAGRIAKDLGLESSFQCPNCTTQMFLKMKLKDAAGKIFEARLVCPSCGKGAN